jgi:tetratricopeptide (TPR) repeat protein
MTDPQKTQPTSPRTILEQAINLAKSGQKIEARELLRRLVALQPVNQAAWLWLSAVASNKAEAEAALAKARAIDPAHPSLTKAEQWLVHRFSAAPLTKKSPVIAPQQPAPIKSKKSPAAFRVFNSVALGLVILALLIGVVVLVLGLLWEVNAAAQPVESEQSRTTQATLDRLAVAQTQRDWVVVIEILEELRRQQPGAPDIVAQLGGAYFQQGLTLRRQGLIEDALKSFEEAVRLTSLPNPAQQELRLASLYVAGKQQYQAGQWPAAIAEFETVWEQDKDYPHVRDLLYSAYYNWGLAQQAAGELDEAKNALDSAITLRPDLSEPRRRLTEIEFAMAPGTPVEWRAPVEDKIIVVGIAEQRMVVYEGNRQVYDFVVSTGEPGRETAIGKFEIQNKIDVAYASTWNLDMPYWLGIYWAGPLQNGIHSLPIVKHTGQKLWDGYLGQRVSYGCVILGDDDAAALYEWAEVGVKVKIVPSLAGWSPIQS